MANRKLDEDDGIDFKKLEKELSAAVEADEIYTRENDAKLRAVHQRVESYDEFRDLVLASNLKPLEKGDKLGVVKKPAPWNPHTNKTPGISQANLEQGNSEMQLPKNTHEFVRDWKRSCKTLPDKFSFLKRLGGARLGQIFKAEISFGLLGEFLQAFEEALKTSGDEAGFVYQALGELATTQRFGLLLDFLSAKEREDCRAVFGHLKALCPEEEAVEETPSERATFSADGLSQLAKLYKIDEL